MKKKPLIIIGAITAVIIAVLFIILFSYIYLNFFKNDDFVFTGKMNAYRVRHTHTLLKDGNILITGGECWNEKLGYKSAEIYNPNTGHFTLIDNTKLEHTWHKTILLSNGNVVILSYNGIEIYDIKTKKFYLAGNMVIPRKRGFSVTLLKNDKILILGGEKYDKNIHVPPPDVPIVLEAEIYDPITEKSKIVGNTLYPVVDNQAIALSNGKIIIVDNKYNIELFDPKTEKFSIIGKFNMTNGVIINLKGKIINLEKNIKEIFNTTNFHESEEESFIPSIDRYNFYEPIILKDNNILLLSSERNYIFYPKKNKFYKLHSFLKDRNGFAATLLNNGKVLVTGGTCGMASSGPLYKEAELFVNKQGRKEK
ncbi:MAG: kelch repeat-containing protein [Cyanobacteriota bacterium]